MRITFWAMTPSRRISMPSRAVRIGDDGAGDMALGGTAVQIQVDFAAERVNRLWTGLRAFVAGTVGAGRGQRGSRLRDRRGWRQIGDADALRARATISGVGKVSTYGQAGYGNRRERAAETPPTNDSAGTAESRPSSSSWSVDASSTCSAPISAGDARASRYGRWRPYYADHHATPYTVSVGMAISTIPDDARRLCRDSSVTFNVIPPSTLATRSLVCSPSAIPPLRPRLAIVHHRSFAVLPFSIRPTRTDRRYNESIHALSRNYRSVQ